MEGRIGLVFTLVVALAACTTATSASTTTIATPTTTATTSTSTTTTIPATTTTTLGSTNTTLLDGNWAGVPLIVSSISDVALGWWDGERWTDATVGTMLDVSGGEDYQTVVLDSEGITTGSDQIAGCDIRLTTLPGVRLADPQLLEVSLASEDRTVFGVAVSAGWDITPREVKDIEMNASHTEAASELLSGAGIEETSPPIKQALEVDIDGDGETETLLVADESDMIAEGSGDYSVVFALEGSDTTIVAASLIPPGEDGIPVSFRVGAVADLNGDGRMEVVVTIQEIEGLRVAVYERDRDGYAQRLQAGCGL